MLDEAPHVEHQPDAAAAQQRTSCHASDSREISKQGSDHHRLLTDQFIDGEGDTSFRLARDHEEKLLFAIALPAGESVRGLQPQHAS